MPGESIGLDSQLIPQPSRRPDGAKRQRSKHTGRERRSVLRDYNRQRNEQPSRHARIFIVMTFSRFVDGRTDLVYDLLASGNPATATDQDGVSLIRWCAYYGDVSAIRFLLTKGESLASLGNNFDLNGACFPRPLAALPVPD